MARSRWRVRILSRELLAGGDVVLARAHCSGAFSWWVSRGFKSSCGGAPSPSGKIKWMEMARTDKVWRLCTVEYKASPQAISAGSTFFTTTSSDAPFGWQTHLTSPQRSVERRAISWGQAPRMQEAPPTIAVSPGSRSRASGSGSRRTAGRRSHAARRSGR
jgi:hypothetical protein